MINFIVTVVVDNAVQCTVVQFDQRRVSIEKSFLKSSFIQLCRLTWQAYFCKLLNNKIKGFESAFFINVVAQLNFSGS